MAALAKEAPQSGRKGRRLLERAISARKMLAGALLVGFAAFCFFSALPDFDLQLDKHFYAGQHRFIGEDSLLLNDARQAFNVVFYTVCAVTLLALFRGRMWLGLTANRWLFLSVCLLAGPLVVANLGLKDHWGRARPRDVIEFGGTKAFTSPLSPSNQCDYNCSFVSGEASSTFMLFFAGAFLLPAISLQLILIGTLLGTTAGVIRMSQGAHFLSDVIFAGVLMAITAAVIQLIFETVAAGGRDGRLQEDERT